MQVQILHEEKALRTFHHEEKVYVEAPSQGDYHIRLTNNSPKRRLAVVSVDGVNVLNGEDASSFDDNGYVLNPWQSVIIKGWRRSDSEVARFRFTSNQDSYAAKTGRGTKNTACIGVAVFDEKPRPVFIHHYHYYYPYTIYPWRDPIWTATDPVVFGTSITSPKNTHSICASGMDLGTAYGTRDVMHTIPTSFEKASRSPNLKVILFYGTTEKLKEWGVPVTTASSPEPFPADGWAVPAPEGWVG